MNFHHAAVSALLLGAILSTSQGLLLTKNTASSCLGEEVIFTCTGTEGSNSLSWSLTVTRDTDIPGRTHIFFYNHYREQSRRGSTWSSTNPEYHVELKLVSVEPVFVSTLVTNLTNIIIDAEVQCQQDFPTGQIQNGRFTLASKVLITHAISACLVHACMQLQAPHDSDGACSPYNA